MHNIGAVMADALLKDTPAKLTYNYNSMLTYIQVSFCFFSKKRLG